MGKARGKVGRPKKSSTPPWQREYRDKNPTVSMVTTPARKKALDIIRGDRSYGEAFEDFMTEKLKPTDELVKKIEEQEKRLKQDDVINQRLRDEVSRLYEELKKYKITYPCAICGKEIQIAVGDADYKDIRGFLRDEGWGHSDCLEED